ncbi:MAG: PEP-CTERM sorting domain-containing protein, partial [Phycisphaeraceae bacterium]
LTYAALIASNNLAQNSWQPQWEGATNFNAELVGTYTYTLSAFDGGTQVASTSIEIQAVPEPSSLALLSLAGLSVLRRRRRQG